MLDGACRSFPAILCMLQLWHSHVPLKANWPCCTARLMESSGDQCSPSRCKWTQTIDRYPTAFRRWVSLKEQNSVGLLAFPPSYICGFVHGPWKMDSQHFYLNHAEILNCSNASAKAVPRKAPGLLNTSHSCSIGHRVTLRAELITTRYAISVSNRSLAKHVGFRSRRPQWKTA